MAGGEWCPYGLGKVAPEMPLDQRLDDAGSLVFDSPPLEKPMYLVGDPIAHLDISSDKPQAFVAVRVSDVAPDGNVTRVTYGLLNLAQRDSQSAPSPLTPGKRYEVRVRLNEIGHHFAPGHRLRVSISTCYWPMVWPSPESATLTLHTGDSRIDLPFMPEAAVKMVEPFGPVEHATPTKVTVLQPGTDERGFHHDLVSNRHSLRIFRDDGRYRIDAIGTEIGYSKLKEISIVGDDPLSMREVVATSHRFHRNDWDARLDTRIVMTCDRDNFILNSDVDAWSSDERIFSRSYHHKIPRDNM
jgi:hypothetical protein